MLIVGGRVRYRTVGRGVMHCERCGGDRRFRRRSGRRWFCVLGVPVLAGDPTGEHLRCTSCRTCYRVELLAVPTIARMRAALAAGTRAAVLAVLGAGPPARLDARLLAVRLISGAGRPGYGEPDLARDLADPGADGAGELDETVADLAIQLDPHAAEWFLAGLIRLGLASGPLTGSQLAVIGRIARCLGLSEPRASQVIARTERAARSG